jgi:hypothetical protein
MGQGLRKRHGFYASPARRADPFGTSTVNTPERSKPLICKRTHLARADVPEGKKKAGVLITRRPDLFDEREPNAQCAGTTSFTPRRPLRTFAFPSGASAAAGLG